MCEATQQPTRIQESTVAEPFVDLTNEGQGKIKGRTDVDSDVSQLASSQDAGIQKGDIANVKGFNQGPMLPAGRPILASVDTLTSVNDLVSVEVRYFEDTHPEANPGLEEESEQVLEGNNEQLEKFVNSIEDTGILGGVTVSKDFKPDGKRYDKDVHYLIIEQLGNGSFGRVNKCIDTSSERHFVRKRVKKEHFHCNELLVPLTVDHVNLAKVYGLIKRENGEVLELLQEFAGQSLFRLVQEHKLTECQIWQLTKQGLSGLAHLHVYRVIHLDIKPENLCIQVLDGGQLLLKIIDFGSAKLLTDPLEFKGTHEYFPPEICQLFLQRKYWMVNFQLGEDTVTGKVDVFAFALTIMFMYKSYHILLRHITNGELSYNKYSPMARQALQEKLMITIIKNPDLVKNQIPGEIDLDMQCLLSMMVIYDYSKRASAADALRVVEDHKRKLVQAQKMQLALYADYKPQIADSTRKNLRHMLSRKGREEHAGKGGKISGEKRMFTADVAQACGGGSPCKNRKTEQGSQTRQLKATPVHGSTVEELNFNTHPQSNNQLNQVYQLGGGAGYTVPTTDLAPTQISQMRGGPRGQTIQPAQQSGSSLAIDPNVRTQNASQPRAGTSASANRPPVRIPANMTARPITSQSNQKPHMEIPINLQITSADVETDHSMNDPEPPNIPNFECLGISDHIKMQ